MNLKDAIRMIGQTARLSTAEGLSVEVQITDAKSSYGNLRFQVVGRKGDGVEGGYAWVDASRVTTLNRYLAPILDRA